MRLLWSLLKSFSWQELRHHPWRNAAALAAVSLGVALAFSVHLINASALEEFSQAVQSTTGQADLELRQRNGETMPLRYYDDIARQPGVANASPVLEFSTYALTQPADTSGAKQRTLLRIVGVDALQVAPLTPDLLPLPFKAEDRTSVFSPATVFINPAASALLGDSEAKLQVGLQLRSVHIAGVVHASGAPLAVMDIAAAQDLFDRQDQLSRVDVRLAPGVDRAEFGQQFLARWEWSPNATLSAPEPSTQRIDNLSRAYRVNLTALAMVALFTGSFLVFSVLALSVTRRSQQFALLAVLGLTARQRKTLVLCEAGILGIVGSLAGIGLGGLLARTALQILGGDLGGGYFSGAAPDLLWSTPAALGFAALGIGATLAGAWWPATLAQGLPAAQTLKGLGVTLARKHHAWWGLAFLGTSLALALMPPIGNVPVAAYASIAMLLLGGITLLPWLVGTLLDGVAPLVARRALPLLAVERARRVSESATIAVSGVVASLSLAVALTVMVSSFRHSILEWLDTVLPADLYVRTAANSSTLDAAFLDPAFVLQAAKLPGVVRSTTQRTRLLSFDAARPAVALIARPLRDPDSSSVRLPLIAPALKVPAGRIGVYVSEAMVDLYGLRPGVELPDFFKKISAKTPENIALPATFFVAGVWRDYARQFGTIAMEQADYVRLSGDHRVNDMAYWLRAGTDSTEVRQSLETLANRLAGTPDGSAAGLLEFGSAGEIRENTLRIFDRSFAVTYWLQAVAIGIGLFGVAASFSAQVLARRKEFGLLMHLGLTRSQILRIVALEGSTWTTLGALAGLGWGLMVAVILVFIVNPQSFHWTMELSVPWFRLTALCCAVIAAGTLTAWLSGRAAAGHDAVMAVKEDW